MKLEQTETGFTLFLNNRAVLNHSDASPAIFIGSGQERMDMYRGNFEIEDYVIERRALAHAQVEGNRILLSDATGQPPRLILTVVDNAITFEATDPKLNRLWVRIKADEDEHVWGGGEQMSYFDMRGRRFPLWTSEPGVGRDPTSEITFKANVKDKAGGDYFNTNYPQPTYVSSALYALHVETSAYSVFDFRQKAFHEIEIWAIPDRIELFAANTFVGLVETLSSRFGRQPPLPDWVYNGAIIGLKDGANSFTRLETMRNAGVEVSALWCEDWVGLRQTSFGSRLFWDWQANETRYPGLRQKISELRDSGIRFLGYVNPYLCVDGPLFEIADKAGYFATDGAGKTALVDFGEFDCGVVDFTNEAAAEWFAEEIVGKNMLDFGLSGWMADFGEYLPIDVHLSNGIDAKLMHNAWPTLWAEVNAKAVASRDKTGDALFFMRAGFTGVQKHCPLLWGGDQSVDFSRHDGLVTVICGALSSGLLGNAYHHSDIGGYTSLFGNVRTPELLMRWAEMAAFTPVMRSHEGNRPRENVQIDQDPEVLAHFARMTRIYRYLAPYLKSLSAEAVDRGLPVQRPLFLHYQDDPQTYAIQDSYLYGADMLIAPVWQAAQENRIVYLPQGGQWVHVWTGECFTGGAEVNIAAPIGSPPVFYRTGCASEALFAGLRHLQ
ncbi:alpha-glucosidase [Agrobacterium rubi]|uniref:Alpha-glucosidase n=2 Tax=Agrobacterium rubi TaxID=28099 RepID=A0AAE7R6A3_9HYPH|nr:alpha-glucosidase [Agrobacterium rubi]MBP1880320.1 alpha-glucosidase [Agrobacterium rubi]NTE88032.1 alpha-glucosidase [Agrobacterium rubi]NTF03799.1 alpha-glucosidase [Agrobacterium rubi]NTF38126.1 alpha-glucosidase [Agrobacterium rubi]OCJ43637.1 alpha-glucosidase [Agrobacterium rubi]